MLSLSVNASDKNSDKAVESKDTAKKEIVEIIQKGCAADMTAAGCKADDVDCLNQYTRANKNFKVSESCNAAKKQVREKRREEFKNKFKEKFKQFQEKRNSGKKDKDGTQDKQEKK